MEIIKSIFYLTFSKVEIILLASFAFVWLIQLYYYLVKYTKFTSKKGVSSKPNREPVSVVICAKNEAENLRNHLEAFLTQDYPDYEVIVVNDCSYDETDVVLAEMQYKYPHLKVTTIVEDERFTHGKKLALTVGIKAASNDILLLSDADCMPVSNQWIASMERNFTPGVEIVLGYGAYKNLGGSLNSIIRYDTMTIALQYFSYALAGHPYMGVGRNLAYRKSLFFKHKGFASHLRFLSGDDDLFVNEAATAQNTRVEFSHESHTISEPKKTSQYWSLQKQRHLSTSKVYKTDDIISLGMEYSSRVLFYLLTIATIILVPNIAGIVVSAFLIRTIVQLIIFKKTMKRLNEKNLLLPSLLFDIIMPYINANFVITNRFSSNKNRWK